MQRVYGIDLDCVEEGAHTLEHVAACAANLPSDSCVFVAEDPDRRWSLTDTLLAVIANTLRGLVWGMSDRRKRGRCPDPIGPKWMTKGRTRTLEARVMTIDELEEELSKPRFD